MSVPRRIQPPVKAVKDKTGGGCRCKMTSAFRLDSVDLDLNALLVPSVRRRSGYYHAVLEYHVSDAELQKVLAGVEG